MVRKKYTEISEERAKKSFGKLVDVARRKEVLIRREKRPVVVMLPALEYKKLLERLDDAYWGVRAIRAMHEGKSLGVEKSEAFLRKVLGKKFKKQK